MTPRAGRVALAMALITPGLGGCATVPALPQADLAIERVHVIDTRTGAVHANQTILIADDRILSVQGSGAGPVDARRRIDGQGAFAIPGLWDAHLHLLQDDGAAALRIAPSLLAFGITHVRDMGSSSAAIATFRDGQAVGQTPVVVASGPAFWAIELPYGDKSQQRVVSGQDDLATIIGEAASTGTEVIKVYAGFQPDRLADLTRAARAAGLPVAGHAQPILAIDEQARLGLSTLEHLETASFTGCGPDPDAYFDRIISARFRNTGETIPTIMAEFDAAIDRTACLAMFRRATAAGLAFTPTLSASVLPPATARALAAALPPGRRETCEVYLQGFGPSDPDRETVFRTTAARLLALIHEAGVPLLAGTDAPAFCATPGPALALELRLMDEAGLSPLVVLQAATLNPARALGFEKRLGAIEPGLEAHIVLLERNPLDTTTAYGQPVGLYTRSVWRDEAELTRLRRASPD